MKTRVSPALALSPFALALVLTGCSDPAPPPETAEITQLRADRDVLAAELAEVQRELDDLRDEISEVEFPEGFLERLEEAPASAQDTVRALTTRVDQLAAATGDAESRAAVLAQRVDSLRTAHDEAVEEYESRLAEGDERARDLEDETQQVAAERDDLQEEISQLAGSLEDLEGEQALAYYVVSTRDELLERGVVAEEGGARFLGFLWRRGEALVPARETDPGDFQTIDLREERTVPMPDPEGSYVVVSRHDPDTFGPEVDPGGRFHGERLEIEDRERFLASSRYLIVVQRD